MNESKYQQCNHSPFLQEPLLSDFGYTGATPSADAVLDGTYQPPPGTDDLTRLLLQHMARPPSISAHTTSPDWVSTEDHQRSWSRAKEYTSAGISGIHFGMYKAQAKDPEMAAYDASRRSIAYRCGEFFDRWNKGVDVMLLKASGDQRAHKLRTILLLEADFNMNNKKLSREGMQIAEDAGCVAPEQAGGRRNHRSNETSLNTTLTLDDSRHRRKAMAIASNDAKGCFDRIVHAVANICMQSLGMPKYPILSMIQVIQLLEHYIRTAFGESDQTYGPARPGTTPYMGLLQGNGAAGTGWTAVSTVIIEAMRSLGFGYSSWAAISKAVIDLVCFQFVDDTDLVHSGKDNYTTGEQVAQEMQDVLDHWDGLLRVTGGALEKAKSYWYLIDYERRQGKWRYKPPSATPGSISLFNDVTNQKEPIECLSAHTAKQALGIYSRPDGNMADEKEYLRKKADKWAESLRTKKIRKDDAWYCLNYTILKAIEHPLVATSFTKQQTDYIMAPILKAGLHSIQVQSNFPRDLVYGPTRYQGLGISDPWAVQLIEHLQVILRHCSRPTITGKLLNTNMENITLELGSGTPFWDLDYASWSPLVTHSWMKYTWKDLSTTALSLKGPMATIKPQRHNDSFLMDLFVAHGFPPQQLITLNEVRMYKQVVRVSDITSANGETLLVQHLNSSPPSHPSPFEWPRSHKPSPNDITLWTNALQQCLLPPHAHHRRLLQPLGPWLPTSDKCWEWWYSPTSNCLYQQVQQQWIHWPSAPTHRQQNRFQSSNNHGNDPPDDAVRATVYQQHNSQYAILLNIGHQDLPPAEPPPALLATRIATLPPEKSWAIDFIETTFGSHQVAQYIHQGTCLAVSDGSLKHTTGAAAFTLVGPTDLGQIHAVNTVPGPIKEGDSYRCELSGIIGIVTLIHILCLHHDITTGAVHVACDNKTSLRVFDSWFVPNPSEESFDLVNALWHMLKESPITWSCEHVYGHQDTKSKEPLTHFEALNIEMDALANEYRENIMNSDTHGVAPHLQVHSEGWSIWHNDQKLASPSRSNLYDKIYAPIIKRYWTSPHHLTPDPRFPPEAAAMIDWDATEALMMSLKAHQRRWCTKHGSENCGVGKTLLAWKKQLDSECPRCSAPEDTTHVLRCTAHNSNAVWLENMLALHQTLVDLETPIDLQDGLTSRLTDWRDNQPFSNDPTWTPQTVTVLQAQDTIGWKNFMEGLPSLLWTNIMDHHYKTNNIDCSSKTWIKKVLKEVHTLAWSQWDHRNKVLHQDDKPRQ